MIKTSAAAMAVAMAQAVSSEPEPEPFEIEEQVAASISMLPAVVGKLAAASYRSRVVSGELAEAASAMRRKPT